MLDAARRELRCGDDPVTLQPKAFEFLLYLIRNRARAIDKDELQDALWATQHRDRDCADTRCYESAPRRGR